MAVVEFMGPIGKEKQNIEAKTLNELKEILQKDESLSKWLDMSAVAVNDEIVNSLDISLKDSDRVTLLPPVCGG
jgi:molybdopterin synthase sulfur carrier subunit